MRKNTNSDLAKISPYPLIFDTILKAKIWGGRKLTNWTNGKMSRGPIGESWLLSDRNDAQSIVQNGSLKGMTLGELFENYPHFLLGGLASKFTKFPLLLKILDVKKKLSLQVHPSAKNANLLPNDEFAKTEAWIILDAKSKSKIFAGLKPHVNSEVLRHINKSNVDEIIPSFNPKIGQGIFLNAGMVHAVKNNVLILEIQQNSDVTFRLFDWEQIDAQTKKPRQLQIESAIECVDFDQGIIKPVSPIIESIYPVLREKIFDCPFFILWRIEGHHPFPIGEINAPTLIFCLKGKGFIHSLDIKQKIKKSDLVLLPASLGMCKFEPVGKASIIVIKIPSN